MRIKREDVLNYLYQRQGERGGYTGQDIVTLANRIGVFRKGLKLRIDEWSVTDPRFSELKYLGKRSVTITLDDVFLIVQLLNENPLIVKQDILDEINRLHSIKGLVSIPKTSFYGLIEQYKASMHLGDRKELKWFVGKKIEVFDSYDLHKARQTLFDIFTFSGLKTFAGVDLKGIHDRLREAETWFHRTYRDVEPYEWYSRVRDRIKVLRNHLSSIKSDMPLPIQARLIFEAQVAFLVDCKDLLIEELIHKGGRIQQKMNESRKKVENEILKKWIEKYSVIGWCVVKNRNEDNFGKLKEILENRKSFANEVEGILIKRHRKGFDLIYDCLNMLTNHFSDNEIIPHDLVAELILDLCRGNRLWQFICEDECLKISQNKALITELRLPNPHLAKAVLAKKLLNYLQNGKLTIPGSFKFQNFGELIKSVDLTDKDEIVTKEDLEMLINGDYPVETPPEITQPCPLEKKKKMRSAEQNS